MAWNKWAPILRSFSLLPSRCHSPGDSKWPFHPLIGGHQHPLKGSLNHPKKVTKNAQGYKFLMILLMEGIPNNHLGCTKPCKQRDIYHINWWSPDFWTINYQVIEILIQLGSSWGREGHLWAQKKVFQHNRWVSLTTECPKGTVTKIGELPCL